MQPSLQKHLNVSVGRRGLQIESPCALAVVSCTRELTLPPLLSGQYRTPLEREISVSVSLTAEE